MSETKVVEQRHQFAQTESKGQESRGRIEPERAARRPAGTRLDPPRRRLLPFVVTLVAAAIATALGWEMWDAYMGAPWTRDGTVRAYVVTLAPEVPGRIVELPVSDNQFVHKGDLLMVIDPTNYAIGVSQAEASVQQAEASVQNIDAQTAMHQAQISSSQAELDRAQAALVFAKQQASRYQTLSKDGWGTVQTSEQYTSQLRQQAAAVRTAMENLTLVQRQIASLTAERQSAKASLAGAAARLRQARVDLERTRIFSPVNGYVTNLLAQQGDFATAGRAVMALTNADSFWVDAYFEETNLGLIHVGDTAEIKLMGYSQIVHGRVQSIARAINVANAQPNGQGVATVNPIFTWVRLAQRVPVRIGIDSVPPDIVLVAGMTATVQIDARRAPPSN